MRAKDQKNKGATLGDCGQATVEAAFLIPVVLITLLLLLQPAFLLYDRMVMASAAADGCRLLATSTSSCGDPTAASEAFIRHRLGCIPPVSCFHVHEGACSWEIELSGSDASEEVAVSIATEVRPLPLIGTLANWAHITNDQGNFQIKVQCSQPVQPAWVWQSNAGTNPEEWVGKWLED